MRASSSRADVGAAAAAAADAGREEKKAGDDELVTYKTYDGIEDVESSESEDDDDRRRREEGAYHDDLMFDSVKGYLPSGKEGRHILLAFIVAQAAMVTLLFYGFHLRDSEFECCNMFAVGVALLFLVVQLFYYADWTAIDGDNPAWHRAMLFAPVGIFFVCMFEWTVGVGGMLAHAQDIDLFGPSFSDLDTLSKVAFVVDSAIGLCCIPVLFALPYAHRNNLGNYYYLRDEKPNHPVELVDYPTPCQGSFHLRSWVKRTARALGIDTPLKANANLPRVVAVATVLQITFYVFAGATYASGEQSNLPIIFLALGAVYCILSIQYSIEATSSRKKRTRKWNRQHLFFGYAGLFIGLGAYMFTMSSVFFKSSEFETELWEDVIAELDTKEVLVFIVTSALLGALLVMAALLAILHRKGWCDGQRDLEFMIETLNRVEEEERQKQAKRQAYLRRMGLVDEAGAPTAEAAEARRARDLAKAKAAKAAQLPPSATRSAMKGGRAAGQSAEPSEVSVTISAAQPDRVTREAQGGKRIVPVDEQFGDGSAGSESSSDSSSSDDGRGSVRRKKVKRASPARPSRAKRPATSIDHVVGDLDDSD